MFRASGFARVHQRVGWVAAFKSKAAFGWSSAVAATWQAA